MKVPFLDLSKQYQAIKDEIKASLEDVLDTSYYILGPKVEAFESDFADFAKAGHCVGCSSGTTALHLALLAAGIGKDDEVITVSHTFIATVWSISYVGATPVFVDVDEYGTMDPSAIRSKITGKTKAIIPVHLHGQPANMTELVAIAKEHGLKIIEDAAQAHGAMFAGEAIGKFADFTCYSFYPGKNLGAYGEAGAVTTNNAEGARLMRELRNHAQPEKFYHNQIGYNYRMDAFQGAVLGVKLKYLKRWTEARREHAKQYSDLLKDIDYITLLPERPEGYHVYHVFAIALPSKADRDSLKDFLNSNGVATNMHYPVPVHLQTAYAELGYKKGDLPKTERFADTTLSLPMYPEMTTEEVRFVVEKIREWRT